MRGSVRLPEVVLGCERDPLGQHGERPAGLLELGQRAPLPLEDHQGRRMEGIARREPPAQELPRLRFGRGRVHRHPLGRKLGPPLEAPLRVPAGDSATNPGLPRSSNNRRRTTSLISDSSLMMRSLATRRTTLVILSCHTRSKSVISIWLRGRLITAAARVVPVTATVRFWMNA